MTTASRRIFFYWLLLIIPTLAVGAAALWLLQREQVHIKEQATAAGSARRVAVEARTRLIAENIGVIMTDVQSGLMATLLDAPAAKPSAYLANWRRTNPLVHEVYVASSTGALRWSTANTPPTAWLTTAPWRVSVAQPSPVMLPQRHDDTQFSQIFDAVPAPAAAPTAAIAADKDVAINKLSIAAEADETSASSPAAEERSLPEQKKQAEVMDNVSQYQNARSAMQSLANYNVNIASPQTQQRQQQVSKAADVSYSEKVADTKNAKTAKMAETKKDETSDIDADANTPILAFADSSNGRSARKKTAAVSGATITGAASAKSAHTSQTTETGFAMDSLGAAANDEDGSQVAPDITGWTPWTDATGALHLFGWRMMPQGTVLAVEVNLETIASRLREVLPANVEPDEAYVLFGGRNTQIAQIGISGASRSETARQPYEQALSLPGWRLIGYTFVSEVSSLNTGAFLLVSGLLIGLFVLAIIGGGSLLMRQARLSAAESAQKTSFVANVSHEFKTPLTTIRLYSELLEQGRIRDESKRTESLQTISRETQRLARLVNNVLDFSRLEQGRKKFNLAEYDMSEEIAKIVDRHAPRIADAGLKLNLVRPATAAPCAIVVKTDLDAVEQIVINLLDNACKYAASGGEITVALRAGAGELEAITITVADRGPGIPPAHSEKIFEKFHRVDDKLTAAQGGAGLGLSIARQLARGLGGDLTYAPREGGGSEFTLAMHEFDQRA